MSDVRLAKQCSLHPKEIPWHIECPYCRIAKLREKIERLRAALRVISGEYGTLDWVAARETARRALEAVE